MNKQEVVEFSIVPGYTDFLESFKRELENSLIADGRIKKDRLQITENFESFKIGGPTADFDPTGFDEFIIKLKNRESLVEISIERLNLDKVWVYLEDSSRKALYSSVRTIKEILTNGDITEVIIEWLQESEITDWGKDFFDEKVNQ